MARHSIGFGIRRLQASDATLAESLQAGFIISGATWSDAQAAVVSSSCVPAERYWLAASLSQGSATWTDQEGEVIYA